MNIAGRITRGLRRAAAPLTLGLLAAALPASAGAAAPAAHFTIRSTVSPSRLIPGDATGTTVYVVTLINSGAEATDGTPITITDELPDGVTYDPAAQGLAPLEMFDDGNEFFPCEPGPPQTCTAEKVMRPGTSLTMWIPVDIAPGASGVGVNEAFASGGGIAEASTSEETEFSAVPDPFRYQSLRASLLDANGTGFTQAEGHPFSFSTNFELSTKKGTLNETFPSENPRVLVAKLPKGFVVNPLANGARCTEAEFTASFESTCPTSSAVGVATPTLDLFGFANNASPNPLWNLVPPPGAAAAFGFNPGGFGIYIHLIGSVNSEGEFELTARAKDIPAFGRLSGLSIELWGNPTDKSHDYLRGACAYPAGGGGNKPCEPAARLGTAQLTMPGQCVDSHPRITDEAEGWQSPGTKVEKTVPISDSVGNPLEVAGCNKVSFAPTISSQPTTTHADSPTGLDFDLHQPQNDAFNGISPGRVDDVHVVLPKGFSLNPAAANGLDACTPAQIGLTSSAPIRFSEAPQSCPDAAKVGTVEVTTPLIDHKLPGSIYLAKPYDNPFGSLLAIYLAVEDEESGVDVKLAGKVSADPASGQLSTDFSESPELPLEDVALHFFNGTKAVLKTPLACGSYETTSDLRPWSSPEALDAKPTDTFATPLSATGSGACPPSEAAAPNAPSFSAGTFAPQAGAFSPFLLKLTRADGTQQLSGIDATLPTGLLGKLTGIPYCPEGDIALARSREAPNQGAVELASPSCPAASEVGTVTVGAGAGISPYYVSGRAYLAGPYKGAPLSLVVITPAVAGPFDLGDVVTRVALYVDEFTAQIHAVSDPLPTILQGIPLDLRSVALRLTRPGFTLNPTSCEQKAITGSATSPAGSVAPLNNRFQVGECKTLAFKPKLKLSLKGPTRRTGHPALKAVVTFPSKGASANIARAQVGLPHGEFLDNSNIGTVCTQPQLKSQTCPAKSIYGKAKAWTPLLEKPLEGPVYLGAGFGHKLPDLVADLNGQIRVLVHGRIDTDKAGGIRNTFEAVPDAPVSKFVLEMQGGKKKGLLVNSENVCRKKQVAEASFTAQNGKVETFAAPIANGCKGAGAKHPKRKGGK